MFGEIRALLTAGALLILPLILSYLINGILGWAFAIEAKAPYPRRKRRGNNGYPDYRVE
jgi:hypothetical protein